MNKDGIRRVFEEYWFFVNYRKYRDNGIFNAGLPQPELLEYLGLPYDADEVALKKRFRELCKKYHPDEGGDPQKFIELMNIKEKYML
ncbi:MAG: DnaJ domain-containing protein [Clostridiales bacterium]|nr:DnaJ domain-containing protein [Clostridiales bacterium]